MDTLHYLNLKKPFLQKKTEENTNKPEFQNFLSLTLHQNDLYHSNVLFVKKFLIDLYTVFCKIYTHLFEIQIFHPLFHPLKTRFTKPRFSENPHLVNKSLLTRHVTKWGFYCITKKNFMYRYRIRANRTSLLIRTPGDTFGAHYGQFRRKIVRKYCNFRRFFTENDQSAPKICLLGL